MYDFIHMTYVYTVYIYIHTRSGKNMYVYMSARNCPLRTPCDLLIDFMYSSIHYICRYIFNHTHIHVS